MKTHLFALAFLLVLLSACQPVNPNADQDGTSSTSPIATDEIYIPLHVRNRENTQQELLIFDSNGLHTLKSFPQEIEGGGIPHPFIIHPQHHYFISGVGSGGYTVVDREGNDVTAQYPHLKDKPFSITSYYQIDTDRFAYSIHSTDAESHEGGAGLFVKNLRDGSTQSLSNTTLGLKGGPVGVEPVCLSKDGLSLYIRSQPWEGFSFEHIWKVRLSDMHAEEVISPDDKIHGFHCSDRKDRLLAIRVEENRNIGMGVPTVPSAILLYDLAANTSRTLKESQDTLFTSAYFAPDGSRIVYQVATAALSTSPDRSPFYSEGSKNTLVLMNADGTEEQVIEGYDAIYGMSRNGNILLVRSVAGQPQDEGELWLLNLGPPESVQPLGHQKFVIVSCPYGLGFDCHY